MKHRLAVTALVLGMALVAFSVVALAAVSSKAPDPAHLPTEAPHAQPAVATVAADPYGVYLANNPNPGLVLSREDAQARAALGCGQNWAPGTVDYALANAYRPTGICGK